MPNKSKGGNKHKRKKAGTDQNERQNMVYKEEGEEYALVNKMVGGGRCSITLPDKSNKLAIIRGKLRRRKTWISPGDLVLVAIRDFQCDKCDVIHKYTPGQLQMLKKKNSLPIGFFNISSDETDTGANGPNTHNTTNYCNVEFREESDDDDDDNNDTITKPKVVDVNNDNDNDNDTSDDDDNKDDTFDFDFDEI